MTSVEDCLDIRSEDVNSKDSFGQTPLMTAICHKQLEVVKELLTRDDLNLAVRKPTGNTALHLACSRGSAAIVALLGQDWRMTRPFINFKNNNLETVVMVAARKGNMDCMEEMAKLQGVNWETKNRNNESLEDIAR